MTVSTCSKKKKLSKNDLHKKENPSPTYGIKCLLRNSARTQMENGKKLTSTSKEITLHNQEYGFSFPEF